jgi:hypothetical protein
MKKLGSILSAFFIAVILFLPILVNVIANSASNNFTEEITETKKLNAPEEPHTLVLPSTSTPEVVKTSSNGGKECTFAVSSVVGSQDTVSGAITSQLAVKVLDLETLYEVINQARDYFNGAYGLTVAFLIGFFAKINIRKEVRFPCNASAVIN